MQQLFVAKSIQLSRETRLNPVVASSLVDEITIPDIKLLSAQSGNHKPLHMSRHKVGDTAKVDASTTADSSFHDLVKRNIFFNAEVEKLSAKLIQLQQLLIGINVDVTRVVNAALHDSTPVIESTSAPLTHLEQIKPATEEKITTSTAVQMPAKVVTPVLASATESNAERPISRYLMMLFLPLLLVITIFTGKAIYSRRQSKKAHQVSAGGDASLVKKSVDNDGPVDDSHAYSLNGAGFSMVKNAYMGSLADADDQATEYSDAKEEGELVLEQALIYVGLHRVNEAIALLTTYIQATPKTALHHWLYLLDIYRDNNQKKEFLQYAKQLHESFNVMLPQWEKPSLPKVIASSLEEFTHISAKVTQLWASCEKESKTLAQTKGYLDQLLMDNRDSKRTGFSMEVFQEIMVLRDILDVREKLEIE